MSRSHRYETTVTWTGNTGTGTSGYRDYQRTHEISADGKPTIPGSRRPRLPRRSGPLESGGAARRVAVAVPHALVPVPVRGAKASWSPTTATTRREPWSKPRTAAGISNEVVLRPEVRFASPAHAERAAELHERAHHLCFIANSVNFPVQCEPPEAGSAEL